MSKTAPQIPFSLHFNQFIKASATGRRLTPSGKRIAAGTIVNYRFTQKLLQAYQEKYGLTLRIQLLHKASMRTLQHEKNYWARFFLRFSAFLYNDKNYHDNYVSGVFKILKTFFNYLQNQKGFMVGNYHRSFRIPLQQAAPVVLQPAQLQYLISNQTFQQSLNTSLKRVKDIFVVGCTVALRFSDLMNLKKSNLVQTGSETYLTLFTQKTGTQIRIPLPAYVLEIIERNKTKTGKYILPRLSSSNMNIQVKKLIKQAGWQHSLQKHISYKGNMKELKTKNGNSWQFYQHITAHTMRRTAITTLLMMGVPENLVRRLSGHAPGSKEFYKYVAIAEEYMNNEIRNAFKKLMEIPATDVNNSNGTQ
jgi:integrase